MADFALHKLSYLLFDVKQKMTDGEYKEIMETLRMVAVPSHTSLEGLRDVYHLDDQVALYIFSCLEDSSYSRFFAYVGEIIPMSSIFPETSSDEEWSPARSHPMLTRSSARLA